MAFMPGFSTGGIHRDSYAAWRDSGSPVAKLYETVPDAPFGCSTEWLSLGSVTLAYSQFTSQKWFRTPDIIRGDDYDHMFVNFRFTGAADGIMNGRDVHAADGSIIFTDLAAPQEHYSEAAVCAGLMIPRKEAEAMFGPVRALHGHVVEPRYASVLIAHLRMLQTQATVLPQHAADTLGRTVMDLLSVGLKASLGQTVDDPDVRERALRVRLHAAIEQDIGSPSLNIAKLVRTLGVSRSTLYRLMEEEGGVQAYIRDRRLAKVAEALRASTHRRSSLSDLADRWGFCDAAYLARCFRERFGVTLGEYTDMHRRR
ncbi:AraC-like DNA-binding protein [Sphingomonas insulae]|uniref:Helix-turn-helix domain-containing protein n=1 Tax=Sphingomonas insulae TaxID=424800 RepID=A0ABN1HNV7_9SPHN|nr:helix-turn-helix domain-containing protein [Sphingomonas insulae]NIJ30837.1 AraC-like DNA-binding protein [Sphingomonas insulae]